MNTAPEKLYRADLVLGELRSLTGRTQRRNCVFDSMQDGDDNQQEPVSTERQSFEGFTNVRICFDACGSAGGVGKLRQAKYLASGLSTKRLVCGQGQVRYVGRGLAGQQLTCTLAQRLVELATVVNLAKRSDLATSPA